MGLPLQEVNAGFGEVGSLACACLIESSAADMLGATSPGQIGQSLETSVRELLAAAVERVLSRLPRASASLPNGRARLALIFAWTITTESAACRSGITGSPTTVPCWTTGNISPVRVDQKSRTRSRPCWLPPGWTDWDGHVRSRSPPAPASHPMTGGRSLGSPDQPHIALPLQLF